jgi:uncharacterized membrane protein YjfL (UPF0719 family)
MIYIMKEHLFDFFITFCWAIIGSLSMGAALFIVITIFNFFTKKVDEWEEIKNNNTSMAIVIAAIIISCAWVVSSIIRP